MTKARNIMGRIAYGIAAACGLILAACISGLPSASCTAMVETYGRSITNFGAVGLFAIVAAIMIDLGPHKWPNVFKNDNLTVLLLFVAMQFFSSCIAASANLRLATQHCFFGNEIELSTRIHKRIKLFDYYDLVGVFGVPGWN